MKLAITACLVAASLALPAAAATARKPAPETETYNSEVATATCGDLMNLFNAATPKKGKDAKHLARAQDDAYMIIMWVHGYISGREGIDLVKRPINAEGIKQTAGQMVEVCKADRSKLFVDAIKNVK